MHGEVDRVFEVTVSLRTPNFSEIGAFIIQNENVFRQGVSNIGG